MSTKEENIYEGFNDSYGNQVLSYEYIERMREEDKREPKKNWICAQRGGQENMLSSNADISICGGSRGGPLFIETDIIKSDLSKTPIKFLKNGDEVFDSNLEICHVLFVEMYGQIPCYEFSFENGEKITSSYDHLWFAKDDEGEMHDVETQDIVSLLYANKNVYTPIADLKIKKKAWSKITSFKFVGNKECACVRVDSKDSLFVTASGIITHNSKSFSILLECVYDIQDPHFEAMILRKEKPDLRNIINDSKNVFKDYGTYLSSEKDQRWVLNNGGNIRFSYYADSYDDFKDRFQGQQYSFIAVDEICQIEFEKFKYLMTDNRNAHGIKNRCWGTCNPDHRSWVRVFIDYWIGKEDTEYNDPSNNLFGLHPERKGLPIPERDGKLRYCFMAGAKTPSDIVWGDTRHEVYLKCKDRIDDLFKKGGYQDEGNAEEIFVLSVCFTEARLKDNKKLIGSDPSYIARLANQDDEQIARDLEGNWDYENVSDDYLSMTDLEDFFNRAPDYGDGVLRASADIGFLGGDNHWMWLIRGNCVIDLDVCQMDAQDSINHVRDKLSEWGVREENFTYDQAGIGQAYKGFFRRAIPFNGQESPYAQNPRDLETVKRDFDTLKSQCAYNLADAIKYGEITISKNLLDRRFSGRNFDHASLREIMIQERKFFNVDERKRDIGKGKCLMSKPDIKKWLHRSPDCMESLLYSRIFWVKKSTPHRMIPRGAAKYVRFSHRH